MGEWLSHARLYWFICCVWNRLPCWNIHLLPNKIANKIWFTSNRLYSGHHTVYRPSTNRTLQLELIGTNLFQHDKDLLCVKWAPWRQGLLKFSLSECFWDELDLCSGPFHWMSVPDLTNALVAEWTQFLHRHTITSPGKLSWRIKGIIKPKREPWKCSWIWTDGQVSTY